MSAAKKKRQSTDEDQSIDTPTEQYPSPKRLRSGKKEQTGDTEAPSPTEKKNLDFQRQYFGQENRITTTKSIQKKTF